MHGVPVALHASSLRCVPCCVSPAHQFLGCGQDMGTVSVVRCLVACEGVRLLDFGVLLGVLCCAALPSPWQPGILQMPHSDYMEAYL